MASSRTIEEPAVVSEPFEVIEHRLVNVARSSHAAGGHAATLAVISRSASSRYWSAMTGHSSCGAVKAACEVVTDNATFPGSIGPMIDPIIPAALAVRGKPGRNRRIA